MKKTFVLLLALVSTLLYGQNSESISQNLSWANWAEKDISVESFFQNLSSDFDLSEGMTWKQIASQRDQSEMTHVRFQQHYYNIPVLGQVYILHSKDGKVVKSNGQITPQLDLPLQPMVEESRAVQLAIDEVDAEKYIWDTRRPYFGRSAPMPSPELVIVDLAYPRNSGRYVLAYDIDIYAVEPHVRQQVLINAYNGEVINSIAKLHSCGGEDGKAQTLYHGERDIVTTLSDSGYVLIDDTRGGGITTQNVDGSMFIDEDNNWEAGSVTQVNGALDVHFGVAATYDFYKDRYQRDGIDGQGSPINAYIFVDSDFNNAYWDGTAVYFGDGDSLDYGPFTAIDVCAHEVTHGVTEHTAGLVYQYESGALNEGFSDIMGKAVEYEFDNANFTWELGAPMQINPNAGFRNMMDPHLYQNPKYYKGQYWITQSFDNGGVHFNSGVVNHWFYLLSDGGSGMNEGGQMFDVPQIGIEAATDIAYHALVNYLTPTSQYLDARLATLEATKDLYGDSCTIEYQAVAEAWMAVGVGHRVEENDLSIFELDINSKVCDAQSLVVSTKVMNNGCATTFVAGTEIDMGYALNGQDTVIETITLDEDLLPGSNFDYTFVQSADLPNNTSYVLNIFVSFADDVNSSNNSREVNVLKTDDVDYDLELLSVNYNPLYCEFNDTSRITILMSYLGCTRIPTGTELGIEIEINGQIINDSYITEREIYPGAFIFQELPVANLPAGQSQATLTISYALDGDTTNNVFMSNYITLDESLVGYLETFERNRYDESRLFVGPATNPRTYQGASNIQNYLGNNVMVITGGDPEEVFPDDDWEIFRAINGRFITDVTLCYNSDGWEKPRLVFDLIQKLSNYDYASAGINEDFINTLSVVLSTPGEEEILDQIRDKSNSNQSKTYSYALPVDQGVISINLEALILKGDTLSNGAIITDFAELIMLDNIKIVEAVNNDNFTLEAEIYPNPASTSITIKMDGSDHSIDFVEAISITGQAHLLSGRSGVYDIGELPSGSYILSVHTFSGDIVNKTFVKQ